MPTVPRYEQQLRPAPMPGVRKNARTSAEAEGAGVARAKGDLARAQAEGTTRVAGAVANVAERGASIASGLFSEMVDRERQAADETALLKAGNLLDDWENERLYSPQSGAFTVKGEAALPLPEQLEDEYQKKADEVGATLTTPQQKMAFERMRAQRGQRLNLEVRRYTFSEIDSYRNEQLKSHVGNALTAAVRHYQDPKLFAVDLQDAVSSIEQNGKTRGLPADTVTEQVLAAQSQAHLGAINNLLALDKDQAAREWFTAAKDQIAPDKWDQVERALEEGTLRKQSQTTADKIIAEGGTLKEQLEKAKGLDDAKLRDAVEQRIEHRDAVLERAKREDEENRMRQGYDILDKTHDVTRIPTTLWSSLDGATRSAMIGYAEKRARGRAIVTDDPTYYSLLRMAGDDPDAFVKENLLTRRPLLDDGDFKQLASIQLSLKSTDRRQADKELAPFRSRQQLVDDTLVLYRIDPNAKADTAQGRAVAQLRRMVDRRVDVLQAPTLGPNGEILAPGKKASNEDIQAEIDRILSTNVTTPGSWWALINPWSYDLANKTKRLIDYTIADVPASERPQIEAALKARSRPVSDETILELYLETQLRSKR